MFRACCIIGVVGCVEVKKAPGVKITWQRKLGTSNALVEGVCVLVQETGMLLHLHLLAHHTSIAPKQAFVVSVFLMFFVCCGLLVATQRGAKR